jgi:serine/threonine protein kinase
MLINQLTKLRTIPQKYFSLSEFKIHKEIGQGGFGNVYLITDKQNNKFALKHIDLLALHPLDYENIVQELKIHQ